MEIAATIVIFEGIGYSSVYHWQGGQKVSFNNDQSQMEESFGVLQVTDEADDYQQELGEQECREGRRLPSPKVNLG